MTESLRISPGRIAVTVVLATLATLAALAATQASPAGAQFAAICQQYPTLPECQEQGADLIAGIEPGAPTGEPGVTGIPVGGPTAAVGGVGKLPFTGYPLTPLLLLLLILVLAGLTIRAYLAIRERLGERRSGPA